MTTHSYHVTGTVIAPGPFVGETRLWVDEAVWPAQTAEEAARIALARLCTDEGIDLHTATWGPDTQIRSTGLQLHLADERWFHWAQQTVATRHYLYRPVDPRCSPLAYIIAAGNVAIGCLIFGRPESTRCYDGALTYGSVEDVASGRARYSRWEVINLARVWLDPAVQHGGRDHIPRAASTAIRMALARLPVDYLLRHPPCFLEDPWMLRQVMSYCDSRIHTGYLYRVCRFRRVRVNKDGIETYTRRLRSLTSDEQELIVRLTAQHPRSRRYRAERTISAVQEGLWTQQ